MNLSNLKYLVRLIDRYGIESVKKEKKLFEEEDYWTGKRTYYKEVCVETVKHPGGLYLFRGALDDAKQERIHIGNSDFSKHDFESNSLAVTLKDKII